MTLRFDKGTLSTADGREIGTVKNVELNEATHGIVDGSKDAAQHFRSLGESTGKITVSLRGALWSPDLFDEFFIQPIRRRHRQRVARGLYRRSLAKIRRNAHAR